MEYAKGKIVEGKITEYKEKSESEILDYLSNFWHVSPNEDGVIKLYASYQKCGHKGSKGNDFAFFIDVRNEAGDILYYPYNLGKVKIWSQYKASFESQPIWQINVRLSEKKFRKANPFELSLANNIVGKPSMKFNDRLDKESYIKKLFHDTGSTEKDAKTIVNALHNIMDDLYTDADERFVYELIQNADDQPREGKKVSVNMQLLNKHFLFMHNGRPFDKDDIYSICDIGSSTKRNSKEKIGYKGIGFKSVFTGSDAVIVNSENYSFAFDKYSPVYSDVNIENIPWQLKPIWQEKYRCPQEVRTNEYFWKSQVGISLEIDEGDARYDNYIRKILSNPLFLLFLKNVESVRYQHSNNDFVVSKKTEDNVVHITQNDETISSWATFDFVVDIPSDIREAMQNDRNVPQKMKEATRTQISFAAKIKDGQIEQISNSVLYAYLPTPVYDFQFNFIVNADFLLTANREQLHTKKIWNQFLFQKIGELLIEWSKTLSKNIASYLNVIPQTEFVEEETGHLALATYFNSAYKSALESEAFILNHKGELAKQDEIIIDKTGLSEIVGADLFCQLLDTEKYLPSEKIDSKILEEDIFEYIDTLKFENVIESITTNSDFNDWFVSASEELKKVFYKWIEDNNIKTSEDKFRSFVSNLPLFQFGEDYKSCEEIDFSGHIITTEHISPIRDVLSKLGFICSDNLFDENHPLFNFVKLQDEKELFDKITLCLLEQNGAGLTHQQKLDLFLTLSKFSNIGPKHLAEIAFFTNSEDQMEALNGMFPYNDSAPEWANAYMISKEDNFPEIQEYLRKDFDVIWENKDVITTEREIPLAVIYNAYKWTDEKYTKELIDKYKQSDNLDCLLSIVEVSSSETKRYFLDNFKILNLYSSSTYKRDSYEYRVLQLALSVFEEPSDFSSKIYFDSKCIKAFSVSDDVVCDFYQNGEMKKVKMSLAKLLPQYQNQSDSIDKIKALFESKKDLDKFFVAKAKSMLDVHRELNLHLNIPEGYFPSWNVNGSAQQFLFATYYRRQKKGWYNQYVPKIDLGNETEEFVYELLDFLFDNNISIAESPFTYHLSEYFIEKCFHSDYVFESERILPIIEQWADDDKKRKFLTDDGVRTEECNAIQFRKLFLENKPINFIDELSAGDITSGIEFIATTSGSVRPFVGENQKNVLLSLKNKCKDLSDEWDTQRMEEQSKEWDSKEYLEWKEGNPQIFIYPGVFPSQLSYNNEILLNYDDPTRDYYYNTQEKKLFVSNVRKIEEILIEVVKEDKSILNIDDYNVLCLKGKVTVSKEDIEKKDKTIETLSEENRQKDEIIADLRAKLKRYENGAEQITEGIKEEASAEPPTPTIVRGETQPLSIDEKKDAQLEAQKKLKEMYPNWDYPDGFGEGGSYSCFNIKKTTGEIMSIVLKSHRTDAPLHVNTNEWDWIMGKKEDEFMFFDDDVFQQDYPVEPAKLFIYTSNDIKELDPKYLIENQPSIALSFSTENLDIEERITAFSDSLHYFKELNFDFESFNISKKAKSIEEIYNKVEGTQNATSDNDL